jgi:hypothetical protein
LVVGTLSTMVVLAFGDLVLSFWLCFRLSLFCLKRVGYRGVYDYSSRDVVGAWRVTNQKRQRCHLFIVKIRESIADWLYC